MPGMDGFEVLQTIRSLERSHGIVGLQACKVVMVTALGDTKNVFKAFNAQCEAYLVKPVDRDKLMAQLAQLGLVKA